MLDIVIPAKEYYNESTNEFVTIKEQKLRLEHSLVSISKWESKWNKPFITTKDKTTEESIDYIRCMTLTQNIDPVVYLNISNQNIMDVAAYIDLPMTATTINQEQSKTSREIITAEIIYYWMIKLNIPFECQKWHINKLLMLINVCSIKEAPPNKMSRNEILSRNKALNEARRKQLKSKG